MKMSEIKIGMKLYHPRHGTGVVTHKYDDSVSLLYGKMTVASMTKNEIKAASKAK
jgi:hypothetical protein